MEEAHFLTAYEKSREQYATRSKTIDRSEKMNHLSLKRLSLLVTDIRSSSLVVDRPLARHTLKAYPQSDRKIGRYLRLACQNHRMTSTRRQLFCYYSVNEIYEITIAINQRCKKPKNGKKKSACSSGLILRN